MVAVEMEGRDMTKRQLAALEQLIEAVARDMDRDDGDYLVRQIARAEVLDAFAEDEE